MRPLGDRVVVRPDKPADRSAGGIWFPDQAKKPVGMGTVIAVGPGMLCKDGSRWPMPVKPGDRIIYDARAPFPKTRIDGEEIFVLRDDTVLGVLEE